MASGLFRLRVAYRKAGRLRWLSHLEVTRALERGIRRADIPYAVTQGFSPHMRVAFGPALPVGTAGEHEALDVWVTTHVPASRLAARLRESLPADLEPLEAFYVADEEPSLSSGVHQGVYDVLVEGRELQAESVQTALDLIRSTGTLEVEHRRKTKVFDLAKSLPKEPLASDSDEGVKVRLTVRMGPEGSLRPEALLNAALAAANVHGVVTSVTRTNVFSEEEEEVRSRPA